MPALVFWLAACATDPAGPTPASPGASTLAVPPDAPTPPLGYLVLNEIQAANATTLTDADGDTPDWIEVANVGPEPVDLGGWGLSDDPEDPHRWTFPSRVLEPGALVLVHASGKGRDEPIAAWDTRVDQGDEWRYLPVKEPAPPDWFEPGFDDGGWEAGPSGFGRGDGDDATEVGGAADAVFARTIVPVTAQDLDDVVALVLHVDFDDAFVAWLNGVEVARANIGEPGIAPGFGDYGGKDHEAQLYQGGRPEVFELDPSVLVEGDNVLAVAVYDVSPESSDLSLVPFLSLGFGSARQVRTSAVLGLDASELHATFQLAAEGEAVALADPLGRVVDLVEPGHLMADWSWGLGPDGQPGYFREPTPGAPNATEHRRGFAATPTFDPPPGRLVGGGAVTIVAASDAVVHYAWDGWEPPEQDPTWDGAPLATGDAEDAVVLRARAWQDGLWPSEIGTGTWLLREPGPLPVVSVVTDPPNLWDDEIDNDVFGTDYEPVSPYEGANFYENWERPVHVAFWEPDQALGFAIDGKIEVHGARSRTHDQRGFRIELDPAAGDARIEHEVFPGLGIRRFEGLLLRSAGNDWYGCFIDGCSEGAHLRDPLMHRLAEGEVDGMAYRPAEAYVNGRYWGIYNVRERQDPAWIDAHHGTRDVDLLEANARVVEGDADHYLATLDYLRTHDLADPKHWAEVERRIDVDELASYLAFQIWADNTDWPGNNIKLWRPREPDGRWRWLLYDTDFGLGSWGHSPAADTLAFALEPAHDGWPNPPWSTELLRLLARSPFFVERFVNRYADYLNTRLRPEETRAALHAMAAVIEPEIGRHSARWGVWTDGATTHTMRDGEWEKEVAWIDAWLGQRNAHAREHLVTNLGLGGTWELALDTQPPGAGSFRLAAVEVEAPFDGTYFVGVPVTITAVPRRGLTFVGWSDPDLPQTETVTLDPTAATSLVARFE